MATGSGRSACAKRGRTRRREGAPALAASRPRSRASCPEWSYRGEDEQAAGTTPEREGMCPPHLGQAPYSPYDPRLVVSRHLRTTQNTHHARGRIPAHRAAHRLSPTLVSDERVLRRL